MGADAGRGGNWRAGAAEVDITPAVGTPLAGYAARTGGSTHVIDPLRAQALVLDDGAQRAVLLTADLLGLHRRLVEETRTRIREALGIPPSHVLLACTHTHAGPVGPWRGAEDDPQVAALPALLAGAARAAAHALRPAVLAVGRAQCSSVQLNRRDVRGPVDPELRVLRVQDAESGALRAALVNFACHPTILAPEQVGISADYPGALRAAVRALCGAEAVVLFANGACADINPVKLTQGPDEVRRVGTLLGAAAARCLEELRPLHGRPVVHTPAVEPEGSPAGWGQAPMPPPEGARLLPPSLAAAVRSAHLPVRAIPAREEVEARIEDVRRRLAAGEPPPGSDERRRQRFLLIRLGFERERGPRPAGTREVEVQALCLGGRFVLVSAPGELFVEVGLAVKRALAAAGLEAAVVGYANDAAGYLPTDEAFDWHGYEVGVSPFDRGTEPALRAAMLAAAGEASGRAAG